MGFILVATIFTQVVFYFMSMRIAALIGIFLSLTVLINQLIYGAGKAGFKFYLPAGITVFGFLILLLSAVAAFIGIRYYRSRAPVAFSGIFLFLMVVINQLLPGKGLLFTITSFTVPGPVVISISAVWFLLAMIWTLRDCMTDTGYRRALIADFKSACASNAKICFMIAALNILMFIKVFFLVAFVKGAPVFFRIISILFIVSMVFFLLIRKYLNMKRLDVSDTRADTGRVPLLYRFLYASLFKPLIICFLILGYFYVLYSTTFSLLSGMLVFLIITILLTLFFKQVNARVGVRH